MVAANPITSEPVEQWDSSVPPAVEINSVSRRFGQKLALDNVSLSVRTGSVLGLVGENGAGKTTLIRHVLGLLKAETGSVSVLGLNPVTEPVKVLSRLGYLSEEPDMPGWMRVHELLRYVAAFYPRWDVQYADRLRQDFGLDQTMRIKHLSKGQRARAGLIAALAYRPDLLVLDEPSSGLDPIVRRDILGAIIRTIAEEGRTVLFSSHLLSEVERVSDYIAMIKNGRVLFCDTLEGIQRRHARLTLRFELSHARPPELPGALAWEGRDREWTAVCDTTAAALSPAIEKLGARIVDQASLNLDEIFIARAGGKAAALEAE
jgi:ABC-2 type transport system ATP-binding protein